MTAVPVTSRAAGLAGECQRLARQYTDRQNAPETVLTPTAVTRLVSALTSAGNVLATLDKFDPAGPAPEGYERTISRTEDGRLVVSFTELPVPEHTETP